MVDRQRIVATDTEPPGDLAKEVEAASSGRYSVRGIADLSPSERSRVEVLVLLRSAAVTRELFRDMPNVGMLQSMSAGVDFIDFTAVPAGVTVCSNAGAYRESIAEHVFAMILYFAKNLRRNHERLREGVFNSSIDGTFLGGKTIGIIGAGGIGGSVARVARSFKMRTIGINTNGRPVEGFDATWKLTKLVDLLRAADVVVVSIPLTIHTRRLIDGRRLSLMKDDCILVNVGRGETIEQAALYSRLRATPTFRAGIDVWWSYPKRGERFSPDFPFFDLPNFLASPHIADGVPEAIRHGQEHAFRNVMRYVRGEPPERVVERSEYLGLKPTHSTRGSAFRRV